MPQPARVTKKEMVTAFRTQEILAAARRVLARRGLEAMTMEDIAQAAVVAKGTLYVYFRGKEDLLQALMSQVGEQIIFDLEGILAGPGPPPEKVRQIVAMMLSHLRRERLLFPAYARELLRGGPQHPSGRWAQVQALEDRFVSLVTDLFAQGIAGGDFIPANPRLLTYLLRSMVRAVGYYQLTAGQDAAVDEALPVVQALLLSGLTPVSEIVREAAP